MKEIQALLKESSAVSNKNGKRYFYTSVVVDNQEIGRLFLRPLEVKALFGTPI